jgi:hypothetical protein
MEKGIAEGILNQSLKEFPLEQQIEKATKISVKFFDKQAKDSLKIQKQKLENLLLRKGYSFEVINIAVIDIVRSISISVNPFLIKPPLIFNNFLLCSWMSCLLYILY